MVSCVIRSLPNNKLKRNAGAAAHTRQGLQVFPPSDAIVWLETVYVGTYGGTWPNLYNTTS